MLLYLAGIHTKDYRPELNVFSSDYDEQRPRIVKATADYDEIMKQE
jgi:heptose-I-phosphate ethanolaminephosphotransferase